MSTFILHCILPSSNTFDYLISFFSHHLASVLIILIHAHVQNWIIIFIIFIFIIFIFIFVVLMFLFVYFEMIAIFVHPYHSLKCFVLALMHITEVLFLLQSHLKLLDDVFLPLQLHFLGNGMFLQFTPVIHQLVIHHCQLFHIHFQILHFWIQVLFSIADGFI